MANDASGWNALTAVRATAQAEIAAAAPDAATAAEGEAYLQRVLTSTLHTLFLGHLLAENGLSRVLPTYGGPNPDYIMWSVLIDPAQRYTLTGSLHQSERAGIGLYSLDARGAALLAGYAAFTPANTARDGSFSLTLAADATGERALPLNPATRLLIVRVLHRDPAGRACTLSLDGPRNPQTVIPMSGSSDGALTFAGQQLLRSIRQFLQWSRLTQAVPNTLGAPPAVLAAEVQGDPDTHYRLGYYELNEGEWLEATIPSGLNGYWSLYAYNHWCESLPGAGVHERNAVADADGVTRVRIGAEVPAALANRVDTLGRRRGVLIFRTFSEHAAATIATQLRR